MTTIAMIPARLGSQRLKEKNLKELDGLPLITRAIRKCKAAGCFDEIWVNSESTRFEAIAKSEQVKFYHRRSDLGDNNATSEDFVEDFLLNVNCDHLLQVHSIAPLLTAEEVSAFTKAFIASDKDVMLSCIEDQIEVAYQDKPINFSFSEKTNSQDLAPTQRITWSVTGWRRESFLHAKASGACATYAKTIGFYPVSAISGHVIKTQTDLDIAEALVKVLKSEHINY